MHQIVNDLITSIDPVDAIERRHIDDALRWLDSGSQICRTIKPDVPPKHLVAYFVVADPERRRVLLVDHLEAGLWLPNGGHVEPSEHPIDTVRREIIEELAMEAAFLIPDPIFLTVTTTVGSTAGHTDVSLWYAVRGDSAKLPWFDSGECRSVRWFGFDELPLDRTDPHLGRFMAKLDGIWRGTRT